MLAIYCRTSNLKSGKQDYSIETQKEGGLKLATKLGMNYEFFVDEGVSGTKKIRPAFGEMMKLISKKKVTHVYCYDQSRIERDSNIWIYFSAECLNNNVEYYPAGNEYNLNDATNMLMASMLSLINSYHVSMTSMKVKSANEKKFINGKTHGLKAYGFSRDKDNNFAIAEDEIEVVKQIFKWKLEGLGNYHIANKLNDMKIPTRKNSKWRGVTIDGIIKNKIYIGKRTWSKHDKENRVETEIPIKIFEENYFNKVNELYSSKRIKVGKKKEFKYLLDEVLFCSKCGQKYYGKKRNESTNSQYKCWGRSISTKHECHQNRGVNIEKMDTFVIKHLFESKTLKEMLINAPKNEGEVVILNEELGKKKLEKEKETRQINKLYNLITNPNFSDDEKIQTDYLKSKKKLDKIKRELDILIEKLFVASNEERNSKTKDTIESYIKEIDFDSLKKMVNSLIEKIEIDYDRNPISHGGNFTFKIKYRNYDEVSAFIAKSTLFDFHWLINYRKQATTPEQLKEDRARVLKRINFKSKAEYESYRSRFNNLIELGLIKKVKSGEYCDKDVIHNDDLRNPFSATFIGDERLTYMNENLCFTKDELINLN
jgi:DNA invertase Pin-like site-specific DNA recombinase